MRRQHAAYAMPVPDIAQDLRRRIHHGLSQYRASRSKGVGGYREHEYRISRSPLGEHHRLCQYRISRRTVGYLVRLLLFLLQYRLSPGSSIAKVSTGHRIARYQHTVGQHRTSHSTRVAGYQHMLCSYCILVPDSA
eukprot:927976-Rhodomonas_salina.4